MIWKFLKQNVLSPKGLNWVQHLVSRTGPCRPWYKNIVYSRFDKTKVQTYCIYKLPQHRLLGRAL